MDNEKRPSQFVFWMMTAFLLSISLHLSNMAREQRKANDIALCIELWKLGGNSQSCVDMLPKGDPNGTE